MRILRMQILLCAATEMEIAPTIDLTSKNSFDVDVLITGVGIVAATYNLAKIISIKRPDFILQAGVAGCIDEQLALTKIVVVENETIGDLGVEENSSFRSLFDLKLLDKNSYPWTNGKLSNSISPLKETGLTIVDGVTVNEISTNKNRIKFYKEQLNASIETMEGAALHYVGLIEKIPFLQLRSLSNFIGERDKSKWRMKEAIAQLNFELERIFSKMFTV